MAFNVVVLGWLSLPGGAPMLCEYIEHWHKRGHYGRPRLRHDARRAVVTGNRSGQGACRRSPPRRRWPPGSLLSRSPRIPHLHCLVREQQFEPASTARASFVEQTSPGALPGVCVGCFWGQTKERSQGLASGSSVPCSKIAVPDLFRDGQTLACARAARRAPAR